MCLVFLWMLETANCPGSLSETGEARAGKKGPKTTRGLRLRLKCAKRKEEQAFMQHFACPRMVVKGLLVCRIFSPPHKLRYEKDSGGDVTSLLCYIPNPSPTTNTEATFGIIVVISWTRQRAPAVSVDRVWCTVDALFHPAGSRPPIHRWGTSCSFFCQPQMKIKESSSESAAGLPQLPEPPSALWELVLSPKTREHRWSVLSRQSRSSITNMWIHLKCQNTWSTLLVRQ